MRAAVEQRRRQERCTGRPIAVHTHRHNLQLTIVLRRELEARQNAVGERADFKREPSLSWLRLEFRSEECERMRRGARAVHPVAPMQAACRAERHTVPQQHPLSYLAL